jgi:hypothetical protein
MKAPFKILYSNDTTNILTCVSPYHKHGENFTKEMLDASVDETAGTGVDAHMLQPGFGWVPMWQSKISPPSKHWEWLKKAYNPGEPDSFLQYLLDGGDIVADFTRRCRAKNLAPFISFRMNDTHHLDRTWTKDIGYGQLSICEFYHDHPEFRLETESNSWRDRGQNWAIPEVREYKFNFLCELCENYDIDGLELDFMRFPVLFRSYETNSEQRRKILSQFISEVRMLLDKTSSGARRWLCIRIPAEYKDHDSLGINVAELAEKGVDMFNLSYYFYTAQTGDLSLIRRQAPRAAMYAEMTSCASVGRAVEKSDGDTFEFIKTSDTQFQTSAAGAYAAGLDGVSLFNFVYYREHGSAAKKGASHEPPFSVINSLRDKDYLSNRPAHYFIGSHWHDDGPLPKCMYLLGQHANFTFRNIVKKHKDSRAFMRAHLNGEGEGDWETWFNNRPIKMVSAPDLPLNLQKREQKILSWEFPASFICSGENHVEIRSKDVTMSVIDFIELII